MTREIFFRRFSISQLILSQTRIHEHLSQIKILIYLNTSKVLLPVKILLMIPVFKLQIQLEYTINLRLKKLYILCGMDPALINRFSTIISH